MVDLEELARRARRAAEIGRLRSASRVALVVVPLTLLALMVSPSRAAIVAIGLPLLGVTIALGWSSGDGTRAVRSGLKLGAVPMAVGLFTVAMEGWCDPNRAVTPCGAGCLFAGLFAGAASAWYAVRTQSGRRLWIWGQVGLVASLTAGLGCVGLGLGGALAVLGAIAAGAALAWIPSRAGA